jgi:hypothetical protein
VVEVRLNGTGLIAQGPIALSFLARLPAFLNRLTLLMNPRVQVATRMANALRAGKAVDGYPALEGMKSVWIFVEPKTLEKTITELPRAVPLANRQIVVCGTLRDSGSFAELNRAGARVATLCALPESAERIFVAEGHAAPLREIARVMAADRRKLIQLKPGAKPLFVSGLHLSSHLSMPWLGAALESFRSSGLTRPEAASAMQALAGAAVRAYIRGGEKALPKAEAQATERLLADAREAIRAVNPRLAEFYDAGAGKWLAFVGGKRFWQSSQERTLHARSVGG